jgi:hypothetical protein
MATSRQAFFARFAREARDTIHAQASSSPHHPLVLLTGGMRSPEVFENALSQGHADLVGIGRGSVLAPRLPLLLRTLSSAARKRRGVTRTFISATNLILRGYTSDSCSGVYSPCARHTSSPNLNRSWRFNGLVRRYDVKNLQRQRD